jgi:hypothetical protein
LPGDKRGRNTNAARSPRFSAGFSIFVGRDEKDWNPLVCSHPTTLQLKATNPQLANAAPQGRRILREGETSRFGMCVASFTGWVERCHKAGIRFILTAYCPS